MVYFLTYAECGSFVMYCDLTLLMLGINLLRLNEESNQSRQY